MTSIFKVDGLKELIGRIHKLIPIAVIEGDEDEPISYSRLVIEVTIDSIYVNYSRNCYHFEDINNLITICEIELHASGYILEENELIEEFEHYLDAYFSGKFELTKEYENGTLHKTG